MGGELFLLCLSVGMLALVGHGIWLLGAAIIRALFGPDPPSDRKPAPPPGRRTHCPRCESAIVAGSCSVCGWPAHQNRQTARLAGLNAIELQLWRYLDLGVIDRATYERLQSSVKAEIATLMQVSAEAATSP